MNQPSAIITQQTMIELEGRGKLKLDPKAYVVSGGEGAIYKPSSDTIIKLYHDRNKMRSDGMPQKLTLLSKISSPHIINPKGLVFENQQPIGYYMNFEEGEALAKMITNSWRQRENFGDKEAIELVDEMREAVKTAHSYNAILVDANELNWIVKRRKPKSVEPKLLDVDSWKIASWDASVIMSSIRDWHTQGFNEKSDWFSLAVVTFQVLTGIHPYKGSLDGFKMNDIESRMKANKSVFTPNVRLNSAVRDFKCIPSPLYDWYEAVFQNGDRSLPPSSKDKSNKTPKPAIVKRVMATKNGSLIITEVLLDNKYGNPAQIFPCGIVLTDSGKLVNLENGKEFTKVVENALECEIIFTPNGYLVAEIGKNKQTSYTLVDKNGMPTIMDSKVDADHLFRFQNRLFITNGVGITEITAKVFGKAILATLTTWPVLINSTKWFRGVGIQDALGAIFLIAPYGEKACEYVRVPELDKKKIIDAIAGARYIAAVVMDNKTGSYQKYELAFDNNYKSYTLRISDVLTPDLNMSLLPKGVTARIPDDGTLVIAVPHSTTANETVVNDPHIESSFLLANWENKVVYIDNQKVWSLSLK